MTDLILNNKKSMIHRIFGYIFRAIMSFFIIFGGLFIILTTGIWDIFKVTILGIKSTEQTSFEEIVETAEENSSETSIAEEKEKKKLTQS